MNQLSGAGLFERLSAEDKARYVEVNRQMVAFALDHAVPLIIAPPLGADGEVKGATGSIVRLASGAHLLTAEHVLAGYERRVGEGERVYWQFGKLPPFDPVPRIAWRDARQDVVLVRLTEEDVQLVGRCRISTPATWPPAIPVAGEMVLLAGYPAKIREVDDVAGSVGSGPFSTIFRVTTVGDDYCTCQISHKDLVSFTASAPPPPGTDFGGISGGPVFLLREGNCHLVGVITDHGYMDFASLELIRIATLRDVRI